MLCKLSTKLNIFKLFDINSSIFSYLRYRKCLLLLYIFCISLVGFLFLYTVLLYHISNIVHLSFVVDSFFTNNLNFMYSKSLSNLLLLDVYSWVCQNRLLDIYDNYILCLAYMSNLNEVSHTSYLLSYNLGGWFETCPACLGKTQLISRITNTDELSMLGMVLNFEIKDFGSFINKDCCNMDSNFVNSKFIIQSTPYIFEDGGLLRIKAMYCATQNIMDSYLSVFILLDSKVTNFINWNGSHVINTFNFDIDSFKEKLGLL